MHFPHCCKDTSVKIGASSPRISKEASVLSYQLFILSNIGYLCLEVVFRSKVTDSQAQGADVRLPGGRGGGRGMHSEFGAGGCELLHLDQQGPNA